MFSQNAEQQSPFCVQALPSEPQFGLIGVHLPLPHVPPQHCPSLVQGWLSLVHDGGWQAPFAQLLEQQSPLALHATPRFVQLPPSPQFVQQPLLPSPIVPSFPPSPFPLSPPHEGAPSTQAAAKRRNAKTQRLLMDECSSKLGATANHAITVQIVDARLTD